MRGRHKAQMTRTRYSIASPFDDWKLVGRWKPDLRRYLVEELELIRSAFTCYDNYQGYLNYEREGRSVGFQENRRQGILNILREWERFQLRRGFLDLMGLAQAAVFAVEEQGAIPEK